MTKQALFLLLLAPLLWLGRELPVFAAGSEVGSRLPAQWQTECAACPKAFYGMTPNSLRLDEDGHPHVAYGGDGLYYAWHDGERWQYATVDESGGVGSGTSLALDADGRPHITYYDAARGDLNYARLTESRWAIETVDAQGDVGTHASLALDADGHPHISYAERHTNDLDLKYAHWTGDAWEITTVDADGVTGAFTSLALDADGHPHISYTYFGPLGKSGADLKYVRWTGTAWEIQTVDGSPEGAGAYTSLALDHNGHPHISYHNDSYSDLMYVHWTGSVWDIQTVDQSNMSGWASSLALDADDRPVIAYMDHGLLLLKLAQRSGNNWSIETVDGPEFVGWSTSLALDAGGRPVISYHDLWTQELRLASRTGGGWKIQIVDRGGKAGWSASLALDAEGAPHVSFCTDDGSEDVRYAVRRAEGWETETVAAVLGCSTSLALDSEDRPHILYTTLEGEFSSAGAHYAYQTGSAWQIAAVEPAAGISNVPALALDAADRPHIAYSRYETKTLHYALWTGSEWVAQTVDQPVGAYGADLSLALDADDQPHISYFDGDNGELRYAVWTGAAWAIKIVDSAGGSRNSLALDAAGRPHIAYFVPTVGGLQLTYARWTGDAWEIRPVTAGLPFVSDTSLAIDAADRPYIAAFEGTSDISSGYLLLAHWTGSRWDIEEVLTGSGISASLALDAGGRPRIAAYDTLRQDLIYLAQTAPPLLLEKVASAQEGVTDGETLTYTLTLYGPGLAAELSDALPDELAYVAGSVTPPATVDAGGRTVRWQGTLPEAEELVIRYAATVDVNEEDGALAPAIANRALLTDTDVLRVLSVAEIVNARRIYLPLVRGF